MKLSSETMAILKNFSTINGGIVFKEGNRLSTVSPQMNILASAEIEEYIPQEFGIYDLNNFLSLMSLFKDGAELEFDSKQVFIKGLGGKSKVTYRFTEPTLIVAAPDKNLTLPSIDVEFSLSEEEFNWILRTANVLSSPNVAIESNGVEAFVRTCDTNNDSAHSNSVFLDGFSVNGKSYKLIFKTENLKLLPGNYDVMISSKGIARFAEKAKRLVYFVTLETSSVYGD